ncbi:glycosyl transferases group 1 [bacterium BMS3Abin04]|nr:glycosyl transferases group 1 [bacterium BMS3Abin04]
MRILQISPQIPVPPTDGGKLSVWGVTKSLAKLGHKVDFVCYLKHDNYKTSVELLKQFCTPYILNVQTDNSFWGALKKLFSPIPYNASKYIRKELVEFLHHYFKRNDVDIVQIEHLHMGWIIDEIRKLTKAKVILREQNLEMLIMRRFYENQRNPFLKLFAKIQYRKFVKFEPQMCAKFDKVIMISKNDEKELKKMDSSINTITIPAGIDSQLLNYKKKDIIPFSLVHIGHTDWYPNLDGLNWFINEVLPEIIKEKPMIKLYIYGGGNTKNYSVPNELKNNVKVVGFVDNLWESLADKALAIVPLRIGGGIRIKILELLATGTIIFTTNVGKEGISVSHNKELLVANTKDEFINSILNYFNGNIDLKQMAKNGRKFIENNFVWEKISKKFENVYSDLLNSKGSQ